jgi:hypothetical protein
MELAMHSSQDLHVSATSTVNQVLNSMPEWWSSSFIVQLQMNDTIITLCACYLSNKPSMAIMSCIYVLRVNV